MFILVGKIIPKNNKLIVFESFLGKQYSDNPRAIYEYLMENHPEYNMYWSVEKQSSQKFNDYNVKYVQRFSLQWLILMNRAKFWVSNSRLPSWISKPPGTIYIQTWHGTPLKKLALDMEEVHMPETNTGEYKENFVNETAKWDYLISPNQYSTDIFKKAFNYQGKIVESGYPRNDYLVNNNTEDEKNKIKKRLKLPKDKKVILYAPTWRDHQFYERGRYKFDIHIDLDLFQKEISNDYILLIRMHYLIAENVDVSKYSGFIYDVSQYEDIRELYILADMLITDYSSVFFDYAILKKPIIFFVYDLFEYRDILRGFYFDFEVEAPGPLVKNTDELITEIKYFTDNKLTNDKLVHFRKKFCSLEDGTASKRVVCSTIIERENIVEV